MASSLWINLTEFLSDTPITQGCGTSPLNLDYNRWMCRQCPEIFSFSLQAKQRWLQIVGLITLAFECSEGTNLWRKTSASNNTLSTLANSISKEWCLRRAQNTPSKQSTTKDLTVRSFKVLSHQSDPLRLLMTAKTKSFTFTTAQLQL